MCRLGHCQCSWLPSSVQVAATAFQKAPVCGHYITEYCSECFSCTRFEWAQKAFSASFMCWSPAETNCRQCWFIGAHSDIGGGYDDAGLANTTLIWMIAQFQKFTDLSFSIDRLLKFLVTDEVITKRKESRVGLQFLGIDWEISDIKETI